MAEAFLTIGHVLRWVGLAASPILLLPVLLLMLPGKTSHFADRVFTILDRITGIALSAAMTAGVLMVLAQLLVVIIRHVFGLAFSWLDETVIYTFAAMFLLAAAGALRDDAHVRVDILRNRFGAHTRAWIELAGSYIFIFPICIMILWAVEPSLTRSWAGFEGSRESDGLPAYFLFRTLIPVFAVLLMAQGLSNALKTALGLCGHRPLEEDDGQTHLETL